MGSGASIPTRDFLAPHFGHPVTLLARLEEALRKQRLDKPIIPRVFAWDDEPKRERRVVWLVGDGTLDNKARVPRNLVRATNGYEAVLSPPRVWADVAHHVNQLLSAFACGERSEFVCINAAVSENLVGDSVGVSALCPQEELVRARIAAEDVLVVSIGESDVLTAHAPATIAAFCEELSPRCGVSFDSATENCCVELLEIFCVGIWRYIQTFLTRRRFAHIVVMTPALASCFLQWLRLHAPDADAEEVLEFSAAMLDLEARVDRVMRNYLFPKLRIYFADFEFDLVSAAEGGQRLPEQRLAEVLVTCIRQRFPSRI